MNLLLLLMLMKGGTANLGSMLPLMLLSGGGSSALSNPLTMLGLASNNTQMTTIGMATAKKKYYPRRRRSNYGSQIAYMRGFMNGFAKGK